MKKSKSDIQVIHKKNTAETGWLVQKVWRGTMILLGEGVEQVQVFIRETEHDRATIAVKAPSHKKISFRHREGK